MLTTTGLSSSEIEELKRAARFDPVEVRFRVPTPDRRLAAALEPGTPPPSLRLAGLRAARRAGLMAGVLVAPLLPGVNDIECDLARLLAEAGRSGAAFVEFGILRPTEHGSRRLVRSLRTSYPRAAARLEVRRLLASAEPSDDEVALEHMLLRLAREFGVALRANPLRSSGSDAGDGAQGRFSFAF